MLKRINSKSLKEVLGYGDSQIIWDKNTKVIKCENTIENNEVIRKYLDDSDALLLVSIYYGMEKNQLALIYSMKNIDRNEISNSEEMKKISTLFENVKIIYDTKKGENFHLSIGRLKKDVIEEYGALLEENIINPDIIEFLKIGDKKKRFADIFNKSVTAFEYLEEDSDDDLKLEDFKLEEFVDYVNYFKTLTNSNYYYMPFEGWSIEEMENNKYFNYLKSNFDRVIVCCCEDLVSSSLIIS